MHKSGAFLAAGLCLAGFATANGALAKPISKTSYSYYTVSGSSPVAIYKALISHGPRVKGVKAYATTTAISSQAGRLVQGKSCRVEGYKVTMNFKIRLPKVANPGALDGATKREWQRFSAFLKKHEETHREIWLDCGSQMERKVAALQMGSCRDLDRKTVQLWKETNAACNKRHEKFDANAQQELLQQSFVKLVMSGATRTEQALNVPRKRK